MIAAGNALLVATVIERAVNVNDGEVVESFSHPGHANAVASCGNHPRRFFRNARGFRKCSIGAAQRSNSHHKRDKLSAEQLHSVAQKNSNQRATVATVVSASSAACQRECV